jgi:uncharacterized membrane protein
MWWEAASEALARAGLLPFALAVKLPVIAADVLIVALLARSTAGAAGPARLAPWLWALHPVSVLVTGFHGQFDALALFAVLGALALLRAGRADASALALGAAIAVKSFPVVLLPVLALEQPDTRRRARYAALAAAPAAALLVPFLLDDARAVVRELFAYGGVADFGWIGAWRAVRWLATGALARAEAFRWPEQVNLSKGLFLSAVVLIATARARGAFPIDLRRACLAVLLAFLALYGALSAQYLLWVIALALLAPDRWLAVYSLAASAALLGFYAFLAPGVLWPAEAPGPAGWGRLWAAGAVLTWVVSVAWLHAAVREGFRPRTGRYPS